MCSLHLTHPSVHTWSSGQPTVQRPGSSRGLPVEAGIRTHNLGLARVSSPTLYPLGQRLPLLPCPYIPVCHLLDPACVLTMSSNKSLQMDPHASRLVGPVIHTVMQTNECHNGFDQVPNQFYQFISIILFTSLHHYLFVCLSDKTSYKKLEKI